MELSFTFKEGAAIKQADVLNIINRKSANHYSRKEIENAILRVFPGVVKKPMKIARSGLHGHGVAKQDQRQKLYPLAALLITHECTTIILFLSVLWFTEITYNNNNYRKR